MTVAIFLLAFALAAANGGNDVPKGVATLAGAGVTKYRTAILWGTVTTLAGCLVSLTLAERMTKLFSSGIVTASPTADFALAVLAGATAWVVLATITRLPVSTTHSIVGALLGAGLLLPAGSIAWDTFPTKVVQPLLLSIGVAFLLSVAVNLLPKRIPECVCVDLPERVAMAPMQLSGTSSTFSPAGTGVSLPRVSTGTVQECRVHSDRARRVGFNINGAHWLSSGATSFARGMNDAPKIVAIAAFALVPAGMTTTELLLVVAGAMAFGSLVAGMRVAKRLGEGVIKMTHVEGFRANLVTAVMVGLAANRGLPLSTTHVSTGAIAGTAGLSLRRLNGRTIRDFVLAWTFTPFFAGTVAALVHGAVR